MGIILASLLLISAVTGILLGLKKEVDLLQPPTKKGVEMDLSAWKPLHEIATIAEKALYETDTTQIGNSIARIDARPTKGMVKVLFDKGYWEVQIDASTGNVLSIAQRHSDWIEALHDGSIISDGFKLVSMTSLGTGLLLMIFTGFWLWYGPKAYRRLKKSGKLKQ